MDFPPSPAWAPSSAHIGVPSGDLAILSAVVDRCPTGVMVLDSVGRLLQANEAACILLGLDARRLLAAHRSDYLHLARRIDLLAAGRDPEPHRQLVLRPDGSARCIEFHIRGLNSGDHPGRASVYLLDEGPGELDHAPDISQSNAALPAGDQLRGQAEILRQIATGGSLEVTLGRLTDLVTRELTRSRLTGTASTRDRLENPHSDAVGPVAVACAVVAERAGGSNVIFPGPGFPTLDPTGLLDALDPTLTPTGQVLDLAALGWSRRSRAVATQLAGSGHGALLLLPIDALPAAGTAGGDRLAGIQDAGRGGPTHLSEPLSDLSGLASPEARPLGLMVCLLDPGAVLAPGELELLRSSADLAAIALERDRSERDLANYALRDPLTGLANRNLLVDRLSQALNRAKRRRRNLALMFLDLDRFKTVNDSLGHHAGDLVLRQFAERLRVLVRPEDTVARFGGDEFVVLVEHVVDEQDAAQIAERVERSMADPFELDGASLAVTVSVGIVIGSGDDDANTLLRKADAAMYRAKELGRNRTEVYDPALETRLANRTQLALDLRHAMTGGLLQLRYRPLLAPAPSPPVTPSAELPALWLELRWMDPDHARLRTREILALAEESGQGLELAAWMVETALAGLSTLTPYLDRTSDRTSDRFPLRLGVPLTGRQLVHPELTDRLLRALQAMPSGGDSAHPAGGALALFAGVPEADVSNGGEVAIRALAGLRRGGVGLALEEIGATPNSSLLSLLGRVTADLLIVDPSVVAALAHGEGRTDEEASPATAAARAMVAGLAGLAHGVELAVAAGGVDLPAQRELLGLLRYDLAWGEAMGPAVDIDTLISTFPPG